MRVIVRIKSLADHRLLLRHSERLALVVERPGLPGPVVVWRLLLPHAPPLVPLEFVSRFRLFDQPMHEPGLPGLARVVPLVGRRVLPARLRKSDLYAVLRLVVPAT